MSNKTLAILGVIAACMVVWAVAQSRIADRPASEPDTPTYLIQGLDPADIGSIVIGTGDDKVTLKRRGRRFVATDKDDYPASGKIINELITQCLSIQTRELYTDNPANHKDLEVTQEDARSIVRFLRAEPNAPLLAGVVIGKSRETGEGTYVRLLTANEDSSNKVYTATDVPWLRERVMDYIDQELITVERKDIESVTLISPDGRYSLKAKAGSEDAELLGDIPEGKKLKDSDARNILRALTDLRFDNVRKNRGDLDFDHKFTCKLKDTTVYTVNIAGENDKTYITCQADFLDKTAVTIDPKGTESEEELKRKEAKLLAQDRTRQFTVTHEPWVYEIADYKADQLTKKLSDLLEDVQNNEDKTEEEAKGQQETGAIAADPNTVTPRDPNAVRVEEPNTVPATP